MSHANEIQLREYGALFDVSWKTLHDDPGVALRRAVRDIRVAHGLSVPEFTEPKTSLQSAIDALADTYKTEIHRQLNQSFTIFDKLTKGVAKVDGQPFTLPVKIR